MDLHKQRIMNLFDCVSPEFGEGASGYFDHFGQRLVERAHLRTGERILDVATGKGAVLVSAVRLLGPEQMVGIDLSKKMLQEAQKRLPPEVQLLQMDAESLTFPDQSFDVIFCAFALYFFPHLPETLAQFKRMLKPHGRLACSTFSTSNCLTEWVQMRAHELGASDNLRVNHLDTKEKILDLFTQNHWNQIEIHKESTPCCFENVDAWWASLSTHGVKAILDQLSPSNLEILRAAAYARAHQLHPSGPIESRSDAWLTIVTP